MPPQQRAACLESISTRPTGVRDQRRSRLRGLTLSKTWSSEGSSSGSRGPDPRRARNPTEKKNDSRTPPRRARTGPNHQKMAAAAARALLDKNGDLTVEQYSAGLAKILGNILAHPAEEKYRRIKAKAKLVQQTILAADGGLLHSSRSASARKP